MKNNTRPNPERIYATITNILQRRYNVRIEYTLISKEQKGATA